MSDELFPLFLSMRQRCSYVTGFNVSAYRYSIGAGVVWAGKHRWVDTHWDRGMSYLKLGWRWRQQQDQRGWQAFAPFWLDPASDPLPVLASRRTIVGETSTLDLPNAA